jgi:hypothetical protein
MATYQNPDITALFRDQARARKAALDLGLANQQQQGADLLAQQAQQYNTARGQAYTNARISALGNNEGLAAAGLASNAYAAPLSGYSETSRIAQNTALGNSLNALNLQQQGAANTVQSQLAQAGTQNQANWLNAQADLQQQEYSAQQSAHQLALQQAQNELQMFGEIRTQAAADALGMPVGTKLPVASGGGGRAAAPQLTADQIADMYATEPFAYSNHTEGYNTGVSSTPTAKQSYDAYTAAAQTAAQKAALAKKRAASKDTRF